MRNLQGTELGGMRLVTYLGQQTISEGAGSPLYECFACYCINCGERYTMSLRNLRRREKESRTVCQSCRSKCTKRRDLDSPQDKARKSFVRQVTQMAWV